jgi:hypothetical protein
MFSALDHLQRKWSEIHNDTHIPIPVAFPLTIRWDKNDFDADGGYLVFDYLKNYRIGFPEDAQFRSSFINAVKCKCAFDNIHACKVEHMDLYLSNIMWNVSDAGKLDIKIINWDTIHREGEPFSSEIIERYSWVPTDKQNFACKEYDLFFIGVMFESQNDKKLWYTKGTKARCEFSGSLRTLLRSFSALRLGPISS